MCRNKEVVGVEREMGEFEVGKREVEKCLTYVVVSSGLSCTLD